MFWFGFVLSFGLARTKKLVEPEVLCLESANFHHFGRFICGIIWKAEAFQKSRAQKIAEARRVGAPRRTRIATKRSREAASEELTQCVNNF